MGILPILIQKFPSNNYQVILKTVWEWCGDDWSESDQGKPENLKQEGSIPRLSGPISSPKGGGEEKSLRGSSWYYFAWGCRCAYYNANRRDAAIINSSSQDVLQGLTGVESSNMKSIKCCQESKRKYLVRV
jgi:hypothetical protein